MALEFKKNAQKFSESCSKNLKLHESSPKITRLHLITLLHELFATRLFRDFGVRTFRDTKISRFFRKFCTLNHFNFPFASEKSP